MTFKTNKKIKDFIFRLDHLNKENLFIIFSFLKGLNDKKMNNFLFFWLGKTFIKDCCLYSRRAKSVSSKYKMNNYILRRKILSKEIVGFKKAIW